MAEGKKTLVTCKPDDRQGKFQIEVNGVRVGFLVGSEDRWYPIKGTKCMGLFKSKKEAIQAYVD